jgi:LysR family transcriptional regulator (chromosome initiation inhibitor)
MLDYPLLAAVAAVVREGSFERAARTLHLTPSAVSQRVKLLEERVGQVLIVRGPPASATAAGLQLCRHIEQVGMLETTAAGAATASDDTGRTARVTVNADSLATWFVNAAASFARRTSCWTSA